MNTIAPLLAICWLALVCGIHAADAPLNQDTDSDGIPDQVEQQILAKFRPWLYYDGDEDVWPCSATWFVQHSSLIHVTSGDLDQAIVQNNPGIILQRGARWSASAPSSDQKLNIDDDFRDGQFAANPNQSVTVPIYGHVAPLPKDWAYNGFTGSLPGCGVLVQYWVLFPYNNAHKWDDYEQLGVHDIGDHEGDWVWIDVILDADGSPRYVVYHHHGDSRLGGPSVVPWGELETRDAAPVAYVEMGVHELWPSAGGEGGFTSPVHSHEGDGVRYRPETVLNLGEAGSPAQQANANAQLDVELALQFSGEWGDFTGEGFGIDNITNPGGPLNQSNPAMPAGHAFPNSASYPLPVIICPPPTVQGTDSGLCSAVVNYTVTASNSCEVLPRVCLPPSGSVFPKGATVVSCTTIDAFGVSASCSFPVTVEDHEPPTITAHSAMPVALWPPNHKMVDVFVSYDAKDNCAVKVTSIAVSCNESVDGKGDGHTSPDWEVIDAHHVKLRAERSGSGVGRVYRIVITATDDSENSCTQTVSVHVSNGR